MCMKGYKDTRQYMYVFRMTKGMNLHKKWKEKKSVENLKMLPFGWLGADTCDTRNFMKNEEEKTNILNS